MLNCKFVSTVDGIYTHVSSDSRSGSLNNHVSWQYFHLKKLWLCFLLQTISCFLAHICRLFIPKMFVHFQKQVSCTACPAEESGYNCHECRRKGKKPNVGKSQQPDWQNRRSRQHQARFDARGKVRILSRNEDKVARGPSTMSDGHSLQRPE